MKVSGKNKVRVKLGIQEIKLRAEQGQGQQIISMQRVRNPQMIKVCHFAFFYMLHGLY